jgi:hypothetical protein
MFSHREDMVVWVQVMQDTDKKLWGAAALTASTVTTGDGRWGNTIDTVCR